MHVDKASIRKIVQEVCGHQQSGGRDLDYGRGEARMARSDLYEIAKEAQLLHDMLHDDDDLPEWVESKITKAADYINTAREYLEYKIQRIG